MRKSFTIKKILILGVMLLLPGLLYYLLQNKGQNRYKPLGIYGSKELSGSFHTTRGKKIPDTLFHTIKNIKLISQKADSTWLFADTTHITVASFFFSRSPASGISINNEMAKLSKTFLHNQRLKFVSITVDPDFDRPSVLKEYSSKFTSTYNNWDFLTGDQKKIYQLAHDGFLVDALKDTTKEANFVHSPMLILIDPQRRIRGYYNSQEKDQMSNLSDEIKVLISEVLRDQRRRESL